MYHDIIYSTITTERENINQTLNSQKTPHILPSPASYGVTTGKILDKTDSVLTASHCTKLLNMWVLHKLNFYSRKICVIRRLTLWQISMSWLQHELWGHLDLVYTLTLVLHILTLNWPWGSCTCPPASRTMRSPAAMSHTWMPYS